MKKNIKIYFLPLKNFIKSSWYGCGAYVVSSYEFIVRSSFRKIYFLLSIFFCVGCDKVLQDVAPQQPPLIPQASTEVFKQMYPDVATFIFKPLETDKTWQTDFVSPRGKVLSLVDYYGEVIDVNELVGFTKTLSSAIKQYVFTNYPNAQILTAYDVMKSSTQTEGYKLMVQTDKKTTLSLFFDANNLFLRQELMEVEKVSSINFTSTDQVNFDSKIPAVVKQFINDNQLKSASVTIYELISSETSLTNATYKIIFNFRERLNGALLTSEVTLSERGVVIQWVSPIEGDFSYQVLNNSNLTTDITNYINVNYRTWQYDYGVSETGFGQVKTHAVSYKNGQKERVLIIDNLFERQDLTVIRSQAVEEKDLPNNIKNVMASSYGAYVFMTGIVTFEPFYQATRLGGKMPAFYQIEIKQGADRYVLRIGVDGKLILKYRVQ